LSLTATARSIPGTLRQEIVIDGKHRLITDQPEGVGGEGSAPSPHELFPAALARRVRKLGRTPNHRICRAIEFTNPAGKASGSFPF
jgi:hypothetical protein